MTSNHDRRAELGRLFDQGMHGHAATDREGWIAARLEAAGAVGGCGVIVDRDDLLARVGEAEARAEAEGGASE